MKGSLSKIDSKELWIVVAFFVMTVVFTWSPIDTFNEVFQTELYPYSKYPVVVHTLGQVILIPGFFLMWAMAIGGINKVFLTLFGKNVFKILKGKLNLLIVAMLIVSIAVIVLDTILWPIAAKANGYSPCPYDTLLFGSKISTAWSKKEAYCYDTGVKSRLSTGTFEQVVEVAKYLDSKKLDKNK
ncbi:hypothetical protein MSP8887_04002 [Marinomonas spartinae]|uniref:DUF1240 domain-containing protein n=1 Tax=Marinomonas spartinae TaxID=1792290 RepID=A0A1A8T420_9GAMM|nr:hypothetical protein [Marinomonas spartinae]SBS25836.1 hypothetical protein MSP8886_00401 [Marinomonas spartinae]SBS39782.1 hypothetical protein MSP8887_04002 [Marinomonas spartinae]